MRPQDAITAFCNTKRDQKHQKNQKDLFLDANAVEDEDFLDENLPPTPEYGTDEKREEDMTENNHQTEAPPCLDIYIPKNIN